MHYCHGWKSRAKPLLCLLWSLQGLRMLIGLAHREALARRLT